MKSRLLRRKRRAPQCGDNCRARKIRRPLYELLEARYLLATDVLVQTPIGTVGENVKAIDLEFSAALLAESARDQANYRLTHLGADGEVGGGDDQVLNVLPQYVDGSTMLRLSTLADLTGWTEVDYGFPAGILGEWQLNAETGGVTELVNGGSTFFVSDFDLLDREFAAQLEVGQDADDDYIGVVFGLQVDEATGLPDSYYLLSWKRGGVGSVPAGMKLARVSGTGELYQRPDLWNLPAGDPYIDILAVGPSVGWQPGTPYEIRVTQQTDGQIDVNVASVNTGQSLWETSVTDLSPLGRGRVGFYNFSQANAAYWNLRSTGSIPSGTYQLEIFASETGLRDQNGDLIDGDADGAAGGNYVQTFTVDIGAPTVGVDLQTASDTGASVSDNLTNDTTPSFDFTANRSGLVEILLDGDADPVATLVFADAATQAWTAPDLADGNHELLVRLIPDLGNVVETSLDVTIDATAPVMLAGEAEEQAPLYNRTVRFSEVIDVGGVPPLLNVGLTGPGGSEVPLIDITGGGDTFVLDFDPLVAPGLYTVGEGPLFDPIVDLAGNAIDPAQSSDSFTLLADTTPPIVTSFTPGGTVKRTVDRLLVSFSEEVRSDTFTGEDVQLTGPDGVTMPAVVAVNPIGDSFADFEIMLASPIAFDGQFDVVIGPAILDLAGNGLAAAFADEFQITLPLPIPSTPGDGVFIELFNGIGGGVPPTPASLSGLSPDGTTLSPQIDFPRPGGSISVGDSFVNFFGNTTTPPEAVVNLSASNFTLRNTFFVAITPEMDLNPATPEIDVQFGVGSDDGFHLTIDDRFLGSVGDRGFSYSWFNFSVESEGLFPATLLFAANAVGASGLEFAWQTALSGGAQIVPQQFLYVTPVLGDQSISFEEVALGSAISDQYRDRGILFHTVSGAPQVTNAFPTKFVPVSPGNVYADPRENPSELGEVDFTFVVPGTDDAATTNFFSMFLIDTETVGATVTAFDPEGNILFAEVVQAGGASQQQIVIQRDRIARVNVTLGQGADTAAIDNITFNTPTNLNSRPVIQPIGDVTIDEESTLSFNVEVDDADLPGQTLSFSLLAGAPSGASINPVTGLFSWRPSELQGPGVYPITVVVRDDGSPRLRAEETFVVTVDEANKPPRLGSLPDRTLSLDAPHIEFILPGVDDDRPVQTLTYSLLSGAPTWASVDADTGLFTATIDGTVADGSYEVTVQVQDNGLGNLSTTGTFQLIVDNARPDLVALDIGTTATLNSGNPFNLSWKVDNVGDDVAGGTWTERVYVANSPTGENRQLLASFVYSDALVPEDAPLERSEQILLPTTSLSGDVYFFVEVDATNNLAESDEQNLFASGAAFSIPSILTLALDTSSVTEREAAIEATVSRNGDASQPLVVAVTPSIAGQLVIPATIIIPAGQYSQRFEVAAAIDDVNDGNASVHLTVAAEGFASASGLLQVIDADRGVLSISTETLTIEEGTSLLVTVSRSVATDQAQLVNLANSNSNQITVPAGVVIPANELSVQFSVQTVNDLLAEKNESVSITATAFNYDPALLTVLVTDDDLPVITLSLDRTSVLESDNGHPIIATVRRATVTNVDIRVKLTSSDTSEAIVPSEVIIPAGQATATFFITPVDDTLLDGSQDVVIQAFGTYASCGCKISTNFGEAIVTVVDDESPALLLNLDSEVVREGISPAGQITISRNTDVVGALPVTLVSSNPAKLVLPEMVEIPAGEPSVTVPFQTVSDGVTTGDELITITASAAGLAMATRAITVTDIDLPDLMVAALQPAAAGLTGQTVDLSWSIQNDGPTTATGTWTERVFISSDNAVGDDLLVGQYAFTGPMGTGQSYHRTIPIQLPNIPGNYWVVVQVDIANTVREQFENNNTRISALPIDVDAAYSAVVMTDVEMAPANTPVLLTGSATRPDGSPAAVSQVSVHLTVRGTKRVLTAITDLDGNFSVTFVPLPGEGGQYTVGAAHPGLPDAPVQDSFKLVGMRAEPPSASLRLMEGEAAQDGQLVIRNLADVPLTGLVLEVLDAPQNLAITAALADDATSLAELETLALNYSVSAADASQLDGVFRLRVSSNEAPAIIVPISFTVVPLVSRLVAEPSSLAASMLVGDQTAVEFTVTNTGGRATGPLTVLLPTGADWLTLGTSANIPSLAAGASTSITLLLTPPGDLPLTAYNGNLVVQGDTTQLNLPFSFRAVSQETGDLQVTVVDEYFFFTEEKPLVTDATVILRDAITGEVIASSASASPPAPPEGEGEAIAEAVLPPIVTIDEDGRVTFEGVAKGDYTLEVRSDNHETYQNLVSVESGELLSEQVFVSRNLVKYIWTVEEVEIEDRTRVTIDALFETNVPAPVVTVDGVIDLADLQVIGQSQQFNIKLTNHGLIAAENVNLTFGSHPFYEITPLISDIGVLPARSEIVIPVIATRIGDFEDEGLAGLAVSGDGLEAVGYPSVAAGLAAEAGSVPCAIFACAGWEYVCGIPVPKCTLIPVTNVEGNCGTGEPFYPVGGERGFIGDPFSPSVSPVVVSRAPTNCDCLGPTILGCALGFIPVVGSVLSCVVGLPQPGSNPDAADWTGAAIGCIPGIPPGVGCAISFAFCLYDIYGSIPNGANLGSETVAGQGLDSTAAASATVAPSWGEEYLAVFEAFNSYMSAVFGVDPWFTEASGPAHAAWLQQFVQATSDSSPEGASLSDEERQQLISGTLPEGITQDRAGQFLDRWQRTVAYWDAGIFNLADVPAGQSTDFWAQDEIYAAAANLQAAYDAFLATGVLDDLPEDFVELLAAGVNQPGAGTTAAEQNEGVCAQVRIQIEQEAVLTRQGFVASLGIENPPENVAIEDLQVRVLITDADGNSANHLFSIQPQFTESEDGLSVPAGTNADVSWLIIPTDEAAPFEDTTYFVGGRFSYTEGGSPRLIELAQDPITVVPQPALDLQYFLQRDVLGDDPFTEPIEPAQPFTLAVMVQNSGAGVANNLRIESAQPKIVENEKGLLIDFEITGTKVNGGEVQRSLTANFGSIDPGDIGIAEWQLEASLQGHFVEYNATFEHLSGLGDERLSLIKSVEIHELIHVADASQVDGDDGLPDFLVNDLFDGQDLPDTLYLSDGTVAPVGLGFGAVIDAPPVLGDLRVAVTSQMTEGWSYLRMEDPSLGDFVLIGVERSDGTMLPAENFWQTDRTFIGGGQRPVLEDKIHLIDLDSTGSYTFIFSNGDLTGPEVASFAGVVPNPTTQTVDVIDVTFTERLTDSSFDATDLSLTKNGADVSLAGLVVAHVSGSTYRISGLAPYTTDDAVYELHVNALEVSDQVGNPGTMAKSFRWVKGETAPTVLQLIGAPQGLATEGAQSIDVVMSKPITLASFTTADLSLTRDGAELIDAQVTITQVGTSTYRVGNLARLIATDGDYRFRVNAAGVMDTLNNAGIGDASAEWSLDTAAPVLLAVIGPATNPRNIAVQRIDVEFSEPIDVATFDVNDLRLVRNGGTDNLITGDDRVTIEDRGDNVYRIGGINWVQAFVAEPQVADFTLTVDATGITDLAGNGGSGVLSTTWTLDLDKPAPADDLALATFSGPVVGGQVNSRQATVTGVLGEPGLTVEVRDMTTGEALARETFDGTEFNLSIEFPSYGQHQLRVRTIDPAGNVTDVFLNDLFVSETPPVVDLIRGLPTEFTGGPLGPIEVVFVAPIAPASFTKEALSITRNGGANLVNGAVSIESLPDGRTFRVNGLEPITADEGLYQLAFNFTNVFSPSGLRSSESEAVSWRHDHTAPTSGIRALELSQELGSILIELTGNDDALAPTVAGSGIVAYDLYYSDNGSPFELLETLAAGTPTTTFGGDPNHIYYFRSIARDAAGNVENKPDSVDAWTYLPDVLAPHTQIDSVDATNPRFEIEFSGMDPGIGLRSFELYVEIDGEPAQHVGTFAAGEPDANHRYAGSAQFQAIANGAVHQYRFYTVGTDWADNTEDVPEVPGDELVSATFAPPTALQVVDFDVQRGANQRSFIRYLDVFFNTSQQLQSIVSTLVDMDAMNDRLRLERYALDGSGSGELIDLNGKVSAVDQALALDFGGEGIGGDRQSLLGDGYYRLSLDLNGDGELETELSFFRLLGDSDGDGAVDDVDLAAINAAMGLLGDNLNEDINGDGRVNILDRTLSFRSRGRMVTAALPLDD